MNFLVLGSGLMGSAVALDLVRSEGVERVTIADADGERARHVASTLASKKVQARSLDVQYFDEVIEIMRGHDCAIGAISFRYNYALSKAALEAGIHYCDLGGNDEVVAKQRTLDDSAKKRNVTIVPNCGLAPGLASVVAAGGAAKLDTVHSIKIRVGGLPQHPKPPLNYQLVFSVEGLMNEYTGKSIVLRDGARAEVDALTEIETIEFPPPFGTLEAFHTSGGTSLLPDLFLGKVRELNYKTIRYPGHCEKFKTLLYLGFASNEPINVGSNLLTEKEVFFELLKRKLPSSGPDVVLIRVMIEGKKNDRDHRLTYNLIDYYDETDNITAMMRTTSYPTSIIAQLIVSGAISARGVLTPEQCVPLGPMISELASRNIRISETLE